VKKFFGALWKLVRSNLVLKIVALLFAVILWSYVLGETNPVRERDVSNVPVTWENVDSLKDKKLAISGNLENILGTVNIRVRVNQNQSRLVNEQNVSASIDLSKVNGTGEQKLQVKPKTEYGTVIEVNPREITVYVDKYKEKDVPISVETTGSVPADYYADPPQFSPDRIRIGGASRDVNRVVSALYTVNLDGLTKGFNRSYEVQLLDEQGGIVDPGLFSTGTPSVIVNQVVEPVKTVEVDVEGSIQGQDNLAPGYELTSVTCEPKKVRIAGDRAVLDTVSSIKLETINVAGYSTDQVIPANYILPEGVRVVDSANAQVSVNIREISEQQVYKNVPLKIKNLPSGMAAAVIPESVDVTVTAGAPHMSKLSRKEVVPYVDVDGLVPGTYSLKVMFELPSGFVAENFVSSSAAVSVTIKNK
jgi:YbbR domain-containing protein